MDVVLVRQAQTRDRRAQQRLLDEVGPLLASLVRRLGIGGEGADQLQGVKVHVLSVLDRFDPAGSARFTTWLTTVVTRFLLMERRRSRPETLSLDDQPLVADAVDPSVHAEQQSLEALVDRALTKLPFAQRRAFVLASIHGLELEAVAALEEVPLGTIKSRLARARMALAESLGPALDRPPRGGGA